MSDNLGTFSDAAKTLSRNPLGIVALFIVLVYAMAALVLGLSGNNGLGAFERVLLVLFLVLFPPGVMWVFRDLVIHHTVKLYGPGDYKDEKNFVDLAPRAQATAAAVTAATAAASGTGLRTAAMADPKRVLSTALRATAAARNAPTVPKVLWVDDKPEGNLHERRALEAAGFSVLTATTTEEALQRIATDPFDVIISDMGRPEGAEAGYDLLARLRSAGNTTPFIIYSTRRSAEQRAEAKRRGALDSTSDPNELLELVTDAIPH